VHVCVIELNTLFESGELGGGVLGLSELEEEGGFLV
jgi:hypothetical protein